MIKCQKCNTENYKNTLLCEKCATSLSPKKNFSNAEFKKIPINKNQSVNNEALSTLGAICIIVGIAIGLYLLFLFSKPGLFSKADLSFSEILIAIGVIFYHCVIGVICFNLQKIIDILTTQKSQSGSILRSINTINNNINSINKNINTINNQCNNTSPENYLNFDSKGNENENSNENKNSNEILIERTNYINELEIKLKQIQSNKNLEQIYELNKEYIINELKINIKSVYGNRVINHYTDLTLKQLWEKRKDIDSLTEHEFDVFQLFFNKLLNASSK